MNAITHEIYTSDNVTKCIRMRLFSSDSQELITVNENILTIYSLQKKLQFINKQELFGTIFSIGCLNENDHQNGLLLLCFKEAKLSTLKFCRKTRKFINFSLHYFEKFELNVNYEGVFEPKIVVDNDQRCICLSFYNDKLAILPINNKEGSGSLIEENGGRDITEKIRSDNLDDPNCFLESFVSDLSVLVIEKIVDLEFMYGFNEPTLGVLTRKKPQLESVTRRELEQEGMKLYIISIDLIKKQFLIIKQTEIKDQKAFLVKALKPSCKITGIMVFSENAIYHVSQGTKLIVIKLNEYLCRYRYDFDFSINLEFNLDKSAVVEVLENGEIIVLDNEEHILCLSLVTSGNKIKDILTSYIKMNLSLLNSGDDGWSLDADTIDKRFSSFCEFDNGKKLFLGSNVGESVLVEVFYTTKAMKIIDHEAVQEENMYIDEEEMLYNTTSVKTLQNDNLAKKDEIREYEFYVTDYLKSIGQISDICVYKYAYKENKTRNRMICVTGGEKQSNIIAFEKNIYMDSILLINFEECLLSWTVTLTTSKYPVLVFTKKEATIVLSRKNNRYNQTKTHEFYTKGKSILVKNIKQLEMFIQVYITGIKTVDYDGRQKHVLTISSTKDSMLHIKAADTKAHYCYIQSHSNDVKVYQLSNNGIYETPIPFELSPICGCLLSIENSGGPNLYYLCVVDQFSSFMIYELASFQQVFCCYNLDFFLTYYENNSSIPDSKNRKNINTNDKIKEIKFKTLSNDAIKNKLLFVSTHKGAVYVYQTHIAKKEERISFFFNIVEFDSILNFENYPFENDFPTRFCKLKKFYSNNRDVVLISGSNPFLVTCDIHNQFVALPIYSKNILYFSKFEEASFLSMNNKAMICVNQLELPSTITRNFFLKKTPVNKKIDKIKFHSPSENLVLITYEHREFKLNSLSKNENMHPTDAALLSDDILDDKYTDYFPSLESYYLELFSMPNYIHIDKIQLEENYVVSCFDIVQLESSIGAGDLKEYLAISTCLLYGEDTPIKSKILIYEIIDVVPQLNRPETKNKLKLIATEEAKTSISTICSGRGFLFAGVGNKILMYKLTPEDSLEAVAFVDILMYVYSLKCVKNYIICGDIYKGLYFLAFQEEPPKIVVLGTYKENIEVCTVTSINSSNKLGFICCDYQKNFYLLYYDPFDPYSMRGQRLIMKGDLYFGREVVSFANINKDLFIVAATSEGSLNLIKPVNDLVYETFLLISNTIINESEQLAGLNPKAYRKNKNKLRLNKAYNSGIIDGMLIKMFNQLNKAERMKIAEKIGVNEHVVFKYVMESLELTRIL